MNCGNALFLFTGLFVTIFTGSCRYKDGPNFTLRSAKSRIVNEWRVHQILENSQDKTADFKSVFPDWKLDIREDHTYTLSYSTFIGDYTETGKWEFLDGGIKINLRKDGSGDNIWTILRLMKDEFWAEQIDKDKNHWEYRLRP